MKKTHYRDYATEAFRFYARVGGAEQYKKQIWNEALLMQGERQMGNGMSKPSEAAVLRAEKAMEQAAAEISDLEAVERTIKTVERMREGNTIMRALRTVYMAQPNRELRRGEITERIQALSLFIPTAERNIYTWLSFCRELFAEERGLRK